MALQIAYRFTRGEVLIYEQAINMLLKRPGEADVAGRSAITWRQRVLEDHGDGSWTLEVQQKPVKFEGILADYLPPGFSGGPAAFRMSSQGAILDVREGTPMSGLFSFPSEPVDEGDSWQVPGDPMGTLYVMQSFERTGHDTIAHLVSSASVAHAEEGLNTTAESAFSISLKEGHQLASTTVIETSWDDGRELSMVVEYTLKSVSLEER
jgi:hypothetical protein